MRTSVVVMLSVLLAVSCRSKAEDADGDGFDANTDCDDASVGTNPDAEELWSTTMDPGQRVLLQVTLDDAASADELFSTLMGEDVEARRSFIQRNARDVRFLDI